MQISLGDHETEVEDTLKDLDKRGTVSRIWSGDHEVWKLSPTEIANRLGWLTVTDWMQDQLPDLERFGEEVRSAGFQHIVLLGMGGSSLGAETLRQFFGNVDDYPRMIVLDSTLPSLVQEVTADINPEKTLFLVSSKSGTTIEPLCLFQHFLNLVQSAPGGRGVGGNFIVITDPGTPLEALGEAHKFRGVFLNPPDIGGRYSVFSYFGMVPAAISGIDVARLVNLANKMREQCRNESVKDNPGAYMGAILGAMARGGRDKVTLVTSPRVAGFGLWVEQLVAESTGKEGKGILPVIGEPLLAPEYYGNDRLFVYIRLEDGARPELDDWMEDIRNAGQPTITMEMDDIYDMGKEFFRWEFATAVAGAVLGINPFSQPDVESAKRATKEILRQYELGGVSPAASPTGAIDGSIPAGTSAGDYLAILAYTHQSMEADGAIAGFRERVVREFRIATTLGYGPRYLHSTGQIHKGGPNKGHFLLITTNHENDLSIPDRPYSFGVLADAQALGDARALENAGRHLLRLHLKRDDADALSEALKQIG